MGGIQRAQRVRRRGFPGRGLLFGGGCLVQAHGIGLAFTDGIAVVAAAPASAATTAMVAAVRLRTGPRPPTRAIKHARPSGKRPASGIRLI
jgi:hypothetical protein